jgi:hypothetical protein
MVVPPCEFGGRGGQDTARMDPPTIVGKFVEATTDSPGPWFSERSGTPSGAAAAKWAPPVSVGGSVGCGERKVLAGPEWGSCWPI